MNKFRKTFLCICLVLILGLVNLSGAFAYDVYDSGAWHDTGTWSFTDYTISPMKQIMGRYIAFRLDFHKPYWDAGLGDIYLKFEIRDAGTSNAITGQYVLGPTGSTSVGDTYYWVDLGYAGRYVEFWFDASSAGASNGNFRSATVDIFRVYVY